MLPAFENSASRKRLAWFSTENHSDVEKWQPAKFILGTGRDVPCRMPQAPVWVPCNSLRVSCRCDGEFRSAYRGIPLVQLSSAYRAYEQQMSSGSSLWVIPQAVREQRQFAILGFLTGFGLSAAIGAVLYICLATG
jgi:hypothetical protein